jgi:ATP-binding cassette subfamily B protein/subfamily B ATP-binding cassette protein MsbA
MIARAKVIGINRGITEGSMMFATTAALIAGAILIDTDSTTPGAVVAAMTIIALLTQSTRNIGRVYEYWHGARIAREKIESFLDEPIPSRKIYPSNIQNGSLVLKGIWNSDSSNFDDISITPGKKIVIVGDNGAGKSTLLKEIAGVIKPKKGHVLLNTIDVMELHEKYLRNMMGMVSPELPLIKGTIRKNICYRRPFAEADEITSAVEHSGLNKFLMQLSDGIEHRVTRGGKNLSLGQQQTIILARAILGSPKILLLDEADSFLDGEMRQVFTNIVVNYSGTVIMATHNMEHITLANEIWVLNNSQLTWRGSPHEFSELTINKNFANYYGH